MLFMRNRINLAIAIVKQAARAIGYMPIIVFTPVAQFIGTILFLLPWTFFVLFLAGTGTITTHRLGDDDAANSYKTFEYEDNTQERAWFLLCVLFWTINFIVAIGQIANAMAVSAWYFARDKDTWRTTRRKTCWN